MRGGPRTDDFFEDEALGKAFDARLMKRLLVYLRPHRLAVTLSVIGLIFVAGAAEGTVKYLIWPAPVLMAVAIMLMEIFIAFLQAYIFAMLTSVFIGLVRHPH